MTSEFLVRLSGMLIMAFVGARFGVEVAVPPLPPEVFALIFGLVGSLAGLILTPYFTTRPARFTSRMILQLPAEVLVASIFGLIFGLIIAALFSVPLSLLPQPFSAWVPAIIAIAAAYLSITIFSFRAQDVFRLMRDLFRGNASSSQSYAQSNIPILLDTSVIIEGRILDISKTGVVGGTLIVPQFLLAERRHTAHSAETWRRSRGRGGREGLEGWQRGGRARVTVSAV